MWFWFYSKTQSCSCSGPTTGNMFSLCFPLPTPPCWVWPSIPNFSFSQDGPGATPKPVKLQSVAVAMAAATWLAFGHPAIADIQTVPLNEATNMAKALQKKPVNKGRVWLLMVLGGAALFGTTVLLENNDRWFPAISKANKAMSASKAKRPVCIVWQNCRANKYGCWILMLLILFYPACIKLCSTWQACCL